MTKPQPRVAIVTGGLSGIGKATTLALLQTGLRVAVGARRGGAADAAEAFGDHDPARLHIGALDVRSEASVAEFCDRVRARWAGIDILVNAAGVTVSQTVQGHRLADWDDVLRTNLTGPFLMARACLPDMVAGRWGRIVNVASTAARTAVADHPAYCASKAGLVGLTKALALEGAPHGVTCLSVSPTWVETDMLRATAAKLATANGTTLAEEVARFAAENPQGRLAQPAEIAHLIAMLCGEEMPALTMEDIQVNAGAHW